MYYLFISYLYVFPSRTINFNRRYKFCILWKCYWCFRVRGYVVADDRFFSSTFSALDTDVKHTVPYLSASHTHTKENLYFLECRLLTREVILLLYYNTSRGTKRLRYANVLWEILAIRTDRNRRSTVQDIACNIS